MSRTMGRYIVNLKLMFEGLVEAEGEAEAEDMVEGNLEDHYAGRYDGDVRLDGETWFVCDDCDCRVEEEEDLCSCCCALDPGGE